MSLRVLLIRMRVIIQTARMEWILLNRIRRINDNWSSNEIDRLTMYIITMVEVMLLL